MARSALLVLLMAALVALPASGWASPEELTRRADDLYSQRAGLGHAESAILTYQKALALDPNRSEPYWKIARALFFLGMHKHGKDAESDFKEAIEYAKLCVQVGERDPGCHFWLGAAYGKYGQVRGVFQSLYLVPFIRSEMARVIALDPGFEQGSAFLALGRMEYLIPEALPGEVHGDRRKALELLRKAAEVAPRNVLARLWLGEMLAEQGDKESARRELKAALDSPIPDNPVPEEQSAKATAEALLSKL
jgi:tetratricopeptide (TPR) repeat protein